MCSVLTAGFVFIPPLLELNNAMVNRLEGRRRGKHECYDWNKEEFDTRHGNFFCFGLVRADIRKESTA